MFMDYYHKHIISPNLIRMLHDEISTYYGIASCVGSSRLLRDLGEFKLNVQNPES